MASISIWSCGKYTYSIDKKAGPFKAGCKTISQHSSSYLKLINALEIYAFRTGLRWIYRLKMCFTWVKASVDSRVLYYLTAKATSGALRLWWLSQKIGAQCLAFRMKVLVGSRKVESCWCPIQEELAKSNKALNLNLKANIYLPTRICSLLAGRNIKFLEIADLDTVLYEPLHHGFE